MNEDLRNLAEDFQVSFEDLLPPGAIGVYPGGQPIFVKYHPIVGPGSNAQGSVAKLRADLDFRRRRLEVEAWKRQRREALHSLRAEVRSTLDSLSADRKRLRAR